MLAVLDHAQGEALEALQIWDNARRSYPMLDKATVYRMLERMVEQTPIKDDPDRKAFACYGLLVSCPAAPDTLPEQVWLRFVEKRPVSVVTTQFLGWCCAKLDKLGKTALIMIWDNASWHISKEVRTWIRSHNRTVKQQGTGVRIVAFSCPARVPGSIELSLTGFTASATSLSRHVCLRLRNAQIVSAAVVADIEAATQGDVISFEFILEHDPDILLVIDRVSAIGQGAEAAEQVMDDELVRATKAWTNDKIVYLDEANWYLASSGINTFASMLGEIEGALE